MKCTAVTPLTMSKRICFVTGNAKKLEELNAILKGSTIQTYNKKIDLPEIQGEPEDVAKEKCRQAFKHVKDTVIVEDTSLCFNALGGLPGVYVKWFLSKLKHEGMNNLLAAYEDKSAYAQCIFVLATPANNDDGFELTTFKGTTDGKIVPARGPNAFGWDPIFEVEGTNQTFAEMDSQAKNKVSHRGRALQKLKEYLLNK